MTSIGATNGPRGSSLHARPSDGTVWISQRALRLCGESFIFSRCTRTQFAYTRQIDAFQSVPRHETTRHRVPSRFDANLLKINDWHTCYPSPEKGARPSRFLSCRRSISQRSSQLSPLAPDFPISISCTEAPPAAETKCRISNPIPESRRASAASDSSPGGII
jgi:hypothetical protein